MSSFKHVLTESEGSNSNDYTNRAQSLTLQQQQHTALNTSSEPGSNNTNGSGSTSSHSTSKSKPKLNDGKLGGKLSLANKPVRSKKTKGRVKIKMEFIENKIRRYTTFSKRKTGIMKKVSLNHLLQIKLVLQRNPES